jgi:hypothetical protein
LQHSRLPRYQRSPPLHLRLHRRYYRAMRRRAHNHNGRIWDREIRPYSCDKWTDDRYYKRKMGGLCACCESCLWRYAIHEHVYWRRGRECRECEFCAECGVEFLVGEHLCWGKGREKHLDKTEKGNNDS